MTNATAREILRLTLHASTANFPFPGIRVRPVRSLLSPSSRLQTPQGRAATWTMETKSSRARMWCAATQRRRLREIVFGTRAHGCSSVTSRGRKDGERARNVQNHETIALRERSLERFCFHAPSLLSHLTSRRAALRNSIRYN